MIIQHELLRLALPALDRYSAHKSNDNPVIKKEIVEEPKPEEADPIIDAHLFGIGFTRVLHPPEDE